MREDALASVRRAYRIAGRDHGAHAPPYPPSPRSRRASGGYHRARGPRHHQHAGAGGFAGFGRELEVLLLLCVVACVPFLSTGSLPGSRRPHPADLAAVDPETGAHGRHPGVNALNNAHAGTAAKGEGAAFAGAPGGYAAATRPKAQTTASKTSSSSSSSSSSSATGATILSTCGDARVWDGVDVRGGDLPGPGDRFGPPIPAPATPEACCAACAKNPSCVAWTLVKDGGVCWLKGGAASRPESDACCVSADSRPGGDAAARAAAARTAELEAQRSFYRGERISSTAASEKADVAGRSSASASRSGRGEDFRFSVAAGGSAAAAAEERRRLGDAATNAATNAAADADRSGSSSGSLLILVPTVARRGVDYLTRTVDSLLAEARDSETRGFERVTIRVVSHSSPAEHPAFRAIRDRPAGAEDAEKRVFLEAAADADRRRSDPAANDAPPVDDTNNPKDIPGTRVRQQTLDLVGTLRDVGGVGGGGGAEYLLLTEDDATMCEGHLGRLSAGVAAASRVDPEWSMLRTSIGFIGIAIKRADANALADFLERHYRVKPPDILLVEWAHGDWEGSVRAAHAAKTGRRLPRGKLPRTHFVSTRNAFEHIGAVSSLRTTGLSHTPECGASLTSFLWATERFRDAAACAEVGVVPCAREYEIAKPRE